MLGIADPRGDLDCRLGIGRLALRHSLEVTDCAASSLRERNFWLPSQQLARLFDTQEDPVNFTRPLGNVPRLDVLLSEQVAHVEKNLIVGRGDTAADIENLSRTFGKCRHVRSRHIIDVNVVAHFGPIPVYNRLDACEHLL